VLELVANSHFLTARELGRLLLRTSKAMTASAFPTSSDVWKSFCSNKRQDCADQLMVATGLSAEERFRKFAEPDQHRPFELRPLQFSPRDCVLVLHASDPGTRRSRFCTKLFVATMSRNSLKKGEVHVELGEPFHIWTKEGGAVDDADKDEMPLLEGGDVRYDVILDLMRLPDQRCVRLALMWSESVNHLKINDGKYKIMTYFRCPDDWDRLSLDPTLNASYGKDRLPTRMQAK
jgi:hypothetical protein